MEKTKINWKEEDNAYINKVFDKVNIGLAFYVILMPLITSLFAIFTPNFDYLNALIIFLCIYIIFKVFYYCFNFRFIKFRKPDLLEIFGLCLFGFITISGIINFNFLMQSLGNFIAFLFPYFYLFAFLAVIRLDKKYYRKLLYTFIITITICSIMGICDLHNAFMPGFNADSFPMSLQFFNPNYSAYITIMAIVLCIYVLWNSRKLAEQIVFWTCFVVLNVALFINGCFSAETAMFIAELFLLIYFWLKNKKCPWIILSCLLISIASSFVWIKGVSTSGANYMFEALGFIDNKLGTHLVEGISKIIDKIFHTGVISEVAGSDGWDREDLKAAAFKQIFSSPKACLFGSGAGINYDIRVHNVCIQMWLEYGFFVMAFYVAILVLLVVRLFKTKFSSHNMFLFAVFIAVALVCYYFGCLEPYSFTYWTCFLAVFTKEINEKMVNLETKENLLENGENSNEKPNEKVDDKQKENSDKNVAEDLNKSNKKLEKQESLSQK